jgi:hypothetical protein
MKGGGFNWGSDGPVRRECDLTKEQKAGRCLCGIHDLLDDLHIYQLNDELKDGDAAIVAVDIRECVSLL